MNRTPLFIAALFVGIVGAGAVWLGPKLAGRSRRSPAPFDSRPEGDSRPDGAGDAARAPVATDPRSAPAAPTGAAAPGRERPRLVVSRAARGVLPGGDAALRFAGDADPRGFAGTWVGAPGFAYTRIPPTDPDGVVRVELAAAAPAVVLTVREADGRPAAGVPVAYAFDGLASATTGPDGRVAIEAMPRGVLRVRVGANARSSPPLRIRMGVDTGAQVVLDPGWAISVRVIDEAGAAVAGARVAARGFDGGRTSTSDGAAAAVTGPDGTARFVTRIDERLAIVVSAAGYETTTIRAPPPDPRVALASDVTVRLREERAVLKGELEWPAGWQTPDVRGEPAVLAPLRERFGREDVGDLPALPVYASAERSVERRPFVIGGLDPGVAWRLSIRGPVVPEDHVVRLDDGSARTLRLRPEPARVGAADEPDRAPPAATTTLRGRVADVDGVPLRGVTVGVADRRATTDADGRFVLEGVAKGGTVELAYGWVDGADPGPADPARFAPWFQVRVAPSDELLSLTLPRATGVRLRLTEGISGKPLSWARIVVFDGEAALRFDQAVATVDGRLELTGLVPGTAGTLVALAPGLRREVPIVLRAGEIVELGEVGLVRAGRVAGIIKDRKGAPIEGASVGAMEDGRVERGGRAAAYGRELGLRRATTDAKGAFVLDGLDTSRPAALAIAADGFAPTGRKVLWAEGEDATLSATLVRGGSVNLQLFDPAGGRVGGAAIELEDARTGVRVGDLLRRGVLGSFIAATEDVRRASASFLLESPTTVGVHRIGPVEPGPYEVIVTCPGFEARRARLTVPDGESGMVRPIPTEVFEWRLELTPTAGGR